MSFITFLRGFVKRKFKCLSIFNLIFSDSFQQTQIRFVIDFQKNSVVFSRAHLIIFGKSSVAQSNFFNDIRKKLIHFFCRLSVNFYRIFLKVSTNMDSIFYRISSSKKAQQLNQILIGDDRKGLLHFFLKISVFLIILSSFSDTQVFDTSESNFLSIFY